MTIDFVFDTQDELSNNYAGWFCKNITIQEAGGGGGGGTGGSGDVAYYQLSFDGYTGGPPPTSSGGGNSPSNEGCYIASATFGKQSQHVENFTDCKNTYLKNTLHNIP
jgi:hypothetical protein